jgi:hypothetical protein
MAEAAMKNAAKAKFGDNVKIGTVDKKCEVKTLLYECRAFARACNNGDPADWPDRPVEAAPACSRRPPRHIAGRAA